MIVGDPEGMRSLATRLDKDASQLRRAAKKAKAAWGKAEASGEWATACAAVIRANAGALAREADRLDGLVSTLRRSADEVAVQIEAERRAAEEAAERARREAVARAAAAETARRAAEQR